MLLVFVLEIATPVVVKEQDTREQKWSSSPIKPIRVTLHFFESERMSTIHEVGTDSLPTTSLQHEVLIVVAFHNVDRRNIFGCSATART